MRARVGASEGGSERGWERAREPSHHPAKDHVTPRTPTSPHVPSTMLKREVLSEEDGSFEEIVNVDDIWDYMTGQLVDALYAVPTPGSASRAGYVLQVNRLIGAVRFMQMRVEEDMGV